MFRGRPWRSVGGEAASIGEVDADGHGDEDEERAEGLGSGCGTLLHP
jgi:hypothetical protein